ncbi:MAG TPA: 50S ribosomal protein L25 [Rhodocyclaceae bacterium]|nr:MAG: 50S ribosomal protein L25/general stress protein Ctc [Betaproteobacteria bacterium CG2_30_68_42]PIV72052.1 MAG: 50S ribosomal protein L25 [Rhodocyclales bacterium CG17_big_fil_post_rev_8_21_14_2_50_68_7]PJA58809.1 MAG: 50S ribosomal protein L25 [Rhodocyclales bacterium CG_4_9_14_3_um_filter_68_10]HCX34889.1 50S ribosomal protein L25 [Rhodocyclaceae bacterium]
MKIEIDATSREGQGTSASRRLRRTGKVPGILYGGTTPPQSIALDHNQLALHLKREAFHASVLTVNVDGAATQALLRDVQIHPVRPQILHVDFQRVDPNRKIHVRVPLHFINAEASPGVKEQGGVASHIYSEVEISCLPANLPEYIVADLKDLSAGNPLRLSGIAMPEGVEAVLRHENPVVASILLPQAEPVAEEEAAAPVEGAAPAAGEEAQAAAPAAPAAAPAKEPGKEHGKKK